MFAISPAIGGKKKVQAIRMRVNFHPIMPISSGRRVTAHNDQEVKKATIVPVPAPARSRATAIGILI